MEDMLSESSRENDVQSFKSCSRQVQILLLLGTVVISLLIIAGLFRWSVPVFGVWYALPIIMMTLTGLQGLASLNSTYRGFLWVWGGAFRSPRDRFITGIVFSIGLFALALYLKIKFPDVLISSQ